MGGKFTYDVKAYNGKICFGDKVLNRNVDILSKDKIMGRGRHWVKRMVKWYT